MNKRLLPDHQKKILMIAYCFPPVGGIGVAGSQRALKFAKYLQSYQWQPIVLTVEERYYEPYFTTDLSLVEKLPKDIKIFRTSVIRLLRKFLEFKSNLKSKMSKYDSNHKNNIEKQKEKIFFSKKSWYKNLKDTFTDLFEIPDEEMGWLLPALYSGLNLIKKEKIDVIYTTGRPWTSHIIGLVLKLITGKPLVVEFRDPWMTNPFRKQYSVAKNKLEKYCEEKVIKKADLVVANTDELKEEFVMRFPKYHREKFITIPNGFDPDDDFSEAIEPHENSKFTIVHTGFLYGKRDPKTLLEAISSLLDKQMIERGKIIIYFVGSIELQYNIEDYLHIHGLRDIIILQNHVSYKNSLEYMRKADVLLLLQPDTKTQIPSKLFEYIGMRKPILAISPRDGSTCNLIMKNSIGSVAQSDNILEIEDVLYKMYSDWQRGSYKKNFDCNAYDNFNVKNIAKLFSENLNNLFNKNL